MLQKLVVEELEEEADVQNGRHTHKTCILRVHIYSIYESQKTQCLKLQTYISSKNSFDV